MRTPELNYKILESLKKKMKSSTENAIRSRLSRLSNKHNISLNAAAECLAKTNGFSINKFLNSTETSEVRGVSSPRETTRKIIYKRVKQKKVSIKKIVEYETSDIFLKEHLDEINICYTFGCYTATFVLCRKIIENLLIHKILRVKYNTNTKTDKEKYYDIDRKRYLDFSIILKNLSGNVADFEPDKDMVKRIISLSSAFKDAANDKTHSLYHIADKKEIDSSRIQDVLNLIHDLEKKLVK